MKKLLILTTATNRAELHKQVFLRYKRFLKCDKDSKLSIVWLINVDFVSKFSQDVDSVLEVRERIERIFFNKRHQITFKWFLNRESGFSKAVWTLFKASGKYLDWADMILYLEDDWNYHIENPKGYRILYFMDLLQKERLDYLGLANHFRTKTVFPPALWSMSHFQKVRSHFLQYYKKDPDKNPEKVCKVFHHQGRHVNHVFLDIGRKWLKKKGLFKAENILENGGIDKMYHD